MVSLHFINCSTNWIWLLPRQDMLTVNFNVKRWYIPRCNSISYVLDDIYNVTAYMDYHPGGWDELVKGAGRDATKLFNDAHR